MKASELKAKWRKDIEKDTPRENNMDDKRLDKLDRCPHIRTLRGGDESMDICELNTKACLIEHGLYECKIWDEIRLGEKGDSKTKS